MNQSELSYPELEREIHHMVRSEGKIPTRLLVDYSRVADAQQILKSTTLSDGRMLSSIFPGLYIVICTEIGWKLEGKPK